MFEFLRLTETLLGTAVAGLVVIATLIAAIYGLSVFIDTRVMKRLKDRTTLETLAALIRPSVIFNADNVVLADLGAMAVIDSIKVEPTGPGDPTPKIITIAFNRFIKLEPLLLCLDPVFYDITASRTGTFSWQFQLDFGASIGTPAHPRFRLEVL